MKHRRTNLLVVLAVSSLSFSCAEHSSILKPKPAPTVVTADGKVAPSTSEFDGTISRIDAEAGFITVAHLPLTKTFKVTPDCQIDILTNSAATLAELKVGDAVSVTYAELGKDLVASHIARAGKAHEREEEEKLQRLDDMLNPSPNQ